MVDDRKEGRAYRYTYLVTDEMSTVLGAHTTLCSAIDHFYLVVEHRLRQGWQRSWTKGGESDTESTRQKRVMLETYVRHPQDSTGFFHNGSISITRMTMRNEKRTRSSALRLEAHGACVVDAEFDEDRLS